MPNPTVASIVERLQSTAVPCSTAWDIHDLLHLPAAIEEQRPLDLKVMRSEHVESSISREPPAISAGPVGRSDGALGGFFPSYIRKIHSLHSSLLISQTTIVVFKINSSFIFFQNCYLTILKLLE